jgi:hypothetical protein
MALALYADLEVEGKSNMICGVCQVLSVIDPENRKRDNQRVPGNCPLATDS